jgi:hypothetical protein
LLYLGNSLQQSALSPILATTKKEVKTMTTAINTTPRVNPTPPRDQGIETAGQFFLYNAIAGTPTAPTGFRQVTINYKQTAAMKAKGEEARDNVYVTVPADHISVSQVIENIETLAPFVSAYLSSVEDATIRAYHKKGGVKVFTETLTMALILETIEETGSSINGEQITEWFTDSCAGSLLNVLAEKLGVSDPSELSEEQSAKVTQVINSYLAQFISLASGKTMLPAAQRERLAKCLQITGADTSAMGIRFTSRFSKMAAKEVEALESLGDLEL